MISAFSVPEPVLEALDRLGKAGSDSDKVSDSTRMRGELLRFGAVPEEAKSIFTAMNVQQRHKELSETRTKDIFVVVQYLRSCCQRDHTRSWPNSSETWR